MAERTNTPLEELRQENARLRGDLRTIAFRIAHDLRRPLGGILYPGEVIKVILAEADPASATLVDSIFNSADEVSHLVQRISFVLNATGKPVSPERMLMWPAVLAALELLERKAAAAGAKISQPEDWPEVNGVADWLKVVWGNLLANALQHAGPNPQIELGWKAVKGGHQFWVADKGPGVPKGKQKVLFQPFHTLHEPDSANGLGLAIVQRLIELQGGSCGYESVPGGGARFFFVLPKMAG